jgi:hypothetical protein
MGDMTNYLTQWSRVLEKEIFPEVVEKFPGFSGAQRFITVFVSTTHGVPNHIF